MAIFTVQGNENKINFFDDRILPSVLHTTQIRCCNP